MAYKVSLVIPVYNVSAYIVESLVSALNQTFQSIEYIIVDDCCTDNSMELVENILKQHPRKTDVYICKHDVNMGLSEARNTGLSVATGDYIYFMDSDDEITQDCIRKHYNEAIKSNAHFTVANIKLVGAKSVHIKDFTDDCMEEDLLASFFMRKWNVSACNKLYLRSFLNGNNLSFQKGLLHEDILWSYNLCLCTNKVAWVKDKTYIYKIRKGSITKSKNSVRKIDSLLFILNSMMEGWKKGLIKYEYKKEFTFMLNFYRFNTALLLLNFSGTINEACQCYKMLQSDSLGCLDDNSIRSLLLKMPFSLFFLLMFPPYFIYKIISK